MSYRGLNNARAFIIFRSWGGGFTVGEVIFELEGLDSIDNLRDSVGFCEFISEGLKTGTDEIGDYLDFDGTNCFQIKGLDFYRESLAIEFKIGKCETAGINYGRIVLEAQNAPNSDPNRVSFINNQNGVRYIRYQQPQSVVELTNVPLSSVDTWKVDFGKDGHKWYRNGNLIRSYSTPYNHTRFTNIFLGFLTHVVNPSFYGRLYSFKITRTK